MPLEITGDEIPGLEGVNLNSFETKPAPVTSPSRKKPVDFKSLAERAANEAENVSFDEIWAMGGIESGNVNAKSSTGVQGPMQVTRGTGRIHVPGFDPKDEEQSYVAGAKEISRLKEIFGNDPEKIGAAYNGGAQIVSEAMSLAKKKGTNWKSELDNTPTGKRMNAEMSKDFPDVYDLSGNKKTNEIRKHGERYIKALGGEPFKAPEKKALDIGDTDISGLFQQASGKKTLSVDDDNELQSLFKGSSGEKDTIKSFTDQGMELVKEPKTPAETDTDVQVPNQKDDIKTLREMVADSTPSDVVKKTAGLDDSGGPNNFTVGLIDLATRGLYTLDALAKSDAGPVSKMNPKEKRDYVSDTNAKRFAKYLQGFVPDETRDKIQQKMDLNADPLSWVSTAYTGFSTNLAQLGATFGLTALGTMAGGPVGGATLGISGSAAIEAGSFYQAANEAADKQENKTVDMMADWQEVIQEIGYVYGAFSGTVEYAGAIFGPLAGKATKQFRETIVKKSAELLGKKATAYQQKLFGSMLGVLGEGAEEITQGIFMNIAMSEAVKEMRGRGHDDFLKDFEPAGFKELMKEGAAGSLASIPSALFVKAAGKTRQNFTGKPDATAGRKSEEQLEAEDAEFSQKASEAMSFEVKKQIEAREQVKIGEQTETVVEGSEQVLVKKGDPLPVGYDFTGEIKRDEKSGQRAAVAEKIKPVELKPGETLEAPVDGGPADTEKMTSFFEKRMLSKQREFFDPNTPKETKNTIQKKAKEDAAKDFETLVDLRAKVEMDRGLDEEAAKQEARKKVADMDPLEAVMLVDNKKEKEALEKEVESLLTDPITGLPDRKSLEKQGLRKKPPKEDSDINRLRSDLKVATDEKVKAALQAQINTSENDRRRPADRRRGSKSVEEKKVTTIPEGRFALRFDLDNFKRVNDEINHNAGDDALMESASIMKQMLGDVADVYRVGGDEFLAISKEGVSREDLRAKGLEVGSEIKQAKIPRDDLSVTVSMGIGRTDAEADNNAGVAKETGRDGLVDSGQRFETGAGVSVRQKQQAETPPKKEEGNDVRDSKSVEGKGSKSKGAVAKPSTQQIRPRESKPQPKPEAKAQEKSQEVKRRSLPGASRSLLNQRQKVQKKMAAAKSPVVKNALSKEIQRIDSEIRIQERGEEVLRQLVGNPPPSQRLDTKEIERQEFLKQKEKTLRTLEKQKASVQKKISEDGADDTLNKKLKSINDQIMVQEKLKFSDEKAVEPSEKFKKPTLDQEIAETQRKIKELEKSGGIKSFFEAKLKRLQERKEAQKTEDKKVEKKQETRIRRFLETGFMGLPKEAVKEINKIRFVKNKLESKEVTSDKSEAGKEYKRELEAAADRLSKDFEKKFRSHAMKDDVLLKKLGVKSKEMGEGLQYVKALIRAKGNLRKQARTKDKIKSEIENKKARLSKLSKQPSANRPLVDHMEIEDLQIQIKNLEREEARMPESIANDEKEMSTVLDLLISGAKTNYLNKKEGDANWDNTDELYSESLDTKKSFTGSMEEYQNGLALYDQALKEAKSPERKKELQEQRDNLEAEMKKELSGEEISLEEAYYHMDQLPDNVKGDPEAMNKIEDDLDGTDPYGNPRGFLDVGGMVKAVKELFNTKRKRMEEMIGNDIQKTFGKLQSLATISGINISDMSKDLSEDEKAVMMFLIEKTPVPKKLGRPDLETLRKKILSGEDPKRTKKLRTLAARIKKHNDDLWSFLSDNVDNLSVDQVKWYVAHIWGKRKDGKALDQGDVNDFKKFITENKAENKRTFLTYSEGIKHGYRPRYLDVIRTTHAATQMTLKSITNRAFIEMLSGKNKAGIKLLAKTSEATDALGWKRHTDPALEGMSYHPDMEPLITSLFETKRHNLFWNTFDNVSGFLKKSQLSLGLFHHLALIETSIATMGFRKSAKATLSATRFMEAVTGRGYRVILDNWEASSSFIEHGGQLGAISDVSRDKVDNLFTAVEEGLKKTGPVGRKLSILPAGVKSLNRKWDAILWDYMHNSLKIEAWKHYEKIHAKELAGPNAFELKRDMARVVNDTFGGQNWEALMANPKTLQIWQALLLSPDWNLSAGRQFLAPTGIGVTVNKKENRWMRSRIGMKFTARAVIKYYGALSLFNAFFRYQDDKERWEKRLFAARKKAAQAKADLVENNYFKDVAAASARKEALAFAEETLRNAEADLKELEKSKPGLAPTPGNIWDYSMLGNAVGHKLEVFVGRDHLGFESYRGFGKQFKEVPQFFFLTQGLGDGEARPDFDPLEAFPKKAGSKVNPVWQNVSLVLFGQTVGGFEDRKLAKAREKGGEPFAKELAKTIVVSALPFSVQRLFRDDVKFSIGDVFTAKRRGASESSLREFYKQAMVELSVDKDSKLYNRRIKAIDEAAEANNIWPLDAFNGALRDLEHLMEEDLTRWEKMERVLTGKKGKTPKEIKDLAKIRKEILLGRYYSENSKAINKIMPELKKARDIKFDVINKEIKK